jgi:hypothetical protein
MTGMAEDISFECRIDESTGDSGEVDREERRSRSVEIVLVGMGEAAEPEYSDNK